MNTETDVYRNLQKKLDKMPLGYPATKSGVELSLLKRIFTPEQAKVAECLDYKHKTTDEIYNLVKPGINSKDELKHILDETVSNGGIFRRNRDGEEQYALLPFLLWGMYEHQLKRLNKGFLDDCGEYMRGEFGLELATSRIPKMRVVPIEESVEADHCITTYDELRNLIKQAGDHIAIQECFCRKVADMQNKHCSFTDRRELCMSFNDLADLYVEEGWARKIDRNEALDIARKNEEDGLVLMPGNEQEPNFLCACCNDCCGMLSIMRNLPRPVDVVASNFYVRVDSNRCKGCGACRSRCPLDAVKEKDGITTVDRTRCIGCGLCTPTCPEKALHLVRKNREVVPPKTEEEHFDIIIAKRNSVTGRLRDYFLKSFLRIAFSLSSKSNCDK